MADLDGSVWVEVATVGRGARLVVPAAARKRLPWASGSATVAMLAMIEADGSVGFVPWEPSGSTTMARVGRLLESSTPEDRARFAVAAADRYHRLGLERDGRVNLPPDLAFHLGAAEGAAVRVVVVTERLSMWPEARWARDRPDRLDEFLGALDRAGPGPG